MLQIINRIARDSGAIISSTDKRTDYITVTICCIGHANSMMKELHKYPEIIASQDELNIRITTPTERQ